MSINPSVVIGPCLTKAHTKGSPLFVREMAAGKAVPDLWLTFVDVREVAMAHIRALQTPEAGWRRYILADTTTSGRLSGEASLRLSLGCPDLKTRPKFHPSWQVQLKLNYQWSAIFLHSIFFCFKKLIEGTRAIGWLQDLRESRHCGWVVESLKVQCRFLLAASFGPFGALISKHSNAISSGRKSGSIRYVFSFKIREPSHICQFLPHLAKNS